VTTEPRLSVVIPTYQRRDSLLRTLGSLRTQILPANEFEVIVAVDGSTDGTAEIVRRLPAPHRLLVLDSPNRGRAMACNSGIRAASGRLVVLLDDDMEASPELLVAHVRAHEGSGRRAVVGAAPIVVTPTSSPFVRYVADGFRARLARLAQPGYQLTFRDTYTGNFSAPRAVLLEVGGFDEAFTAYGHEDYELALRLRQHGVELAYRADALAEQHYEKTFAAFARDGIARGRTAVLLAGKHPAVAGQLKLAEYHRETRKWRALRGLLLTATRVTDRVPTWVCAAISRLEAREPAWLHRCYAMAIDYFYWLGALGALREQRTSGRTGPIASNPSRASRQVGQT
jgi:GT2 family glycosyltransferase